MSCGNDVPGFAVSDASAPRSAGAMVFEITKEAGVNYLPSEVEFTTRSGTATALDYVPISGRLTFTAFETRKLVTVALIGEESLVDKWFQLRLRIISNGKLLDSVGVGTITEADALLLESGDFWLREDGGLTLLEHA